MKARVIAMAAAALVLSAGASAQEPKILARFRIATDGRPIVLPVTFQGKTYAFLLDTATRNTTFDESLRDLLGEPRSTQTIPLDDGETEEINTYYAPAAKVGPIDLQQAGPALVADLQPLREITGLNIQGVLGTGLLRKYAIAIDFQKGLLDFIDPGPRIHTAWGLPRQITISRQGMPFIQGEIAGRFVVLFLIDTGFFANGSFADELFEKLQQRKIITRTATSQYLTGRGTRESVQGRVPALQIGRPEDGFDPMKHAELIFDKGGDVSILGLEWLARHHVVIDFVNSRIYLRKAPGYDAPDTSDMSGMHILRTDQGVEVTALDKGSPAEEAGLKPGDVLVKINDKPIGEYAMVDLRRLLSSGEGKQFTFIFQRDGKVWRSRPMTLRKDI